MKILNIVGARPNFIKIAPILHQMRQEAGITPLLLHTGQHYDDRMNKIFFEQLNIPAPNYNLDVRADTNAGQAAKIIERFEPVLKREKPSVIVVVGDVNSTISCALVAAYHQIPVVHVEAGLRSFDRSMPEEVNRVLTDRISDLLFTTEEAGKLNLLKEGVSAEKIHFVGNVMVDSLLKSITLAKESSDVMEKLKLSKNGYALLTLHRPSNVDDPAVLESLLEVMGRIAKKIPIVFPLHPRTEKRVEEFSLQDLLNPLTITPPLPYLDSIKLMANSALVLTDSGGMQEETTILNVPCLTLRKNTERPVTIEKGSNCLVGVDPEKIYAEAEAVLNGRGKRGEAPPLWDGRAAERIVATLKKIYQ